jgi:hypothetical protein
MTEKKQYVLRTCNKDYRSYNHFKWPEIGPVEAPDWDPKPECGNGLHGALWGEGDGILFSWESDAVWQVVRVDGPMVDLDGKVKFQKGFVVFSGSQKDATDKIISLGASGPVIGASIIVGNNKQAHTGYKGNSTSGYEGTSTSGYEGTSTSGRYGTSISEDFGTSTSGYEGTSTSGYKGTSSSGNEGTSISGDFGNSTSGDFGTSISGYKGTAISGYKGTSISGDFGTSISGEKGKIVIDYWDSEADRYRSVTGYIGEDGLEPNIPYKLDANHKFIKA